MTGMELVKLILLNDVLDRDIYIPERHGYTWDIANGINYATFDKEIPIYLFHKKDPVTNTPSSDSETR